MTDEQKQDKRKEYARRYRLSQKLDPERQDAARAYGRAYYQNNKEKLRERSAVAARKPAAKERTRQRNSSEIARIERLKSKHGITLEQFKAMEKSQVGLCAICKGPPNKVSRGIRRTTPVLVVDHCHVTGSIRGLLCDRCNTGLGQFKDSVSNLRNALNYLERYSKI
jgi:Recombination endonuclease VII